MNAFQGSERLIYEYILRRGKEIGGLSAKTIAHDNFTTTTSVNRVCKKMGYASYTELRYKFTRDQALFKPIEREMSSDEPPFLNSVCELLANSGHIYLYARGATLTSLNYLSRFLSLANLPHLMLNDIHQLTCVVKGTLVLLSKSGETHSLIEMAHNAHRKGLKVLVITSRNSTLESLGTVCWPLEINRNPISLYQREGQLDLLMVVDRIGCHLLQHNAV
ncbi:MurR/RpiR family transcriptional regulator [Buttiauxella sp. 3AFRM03]|uniref:MurR/RpiR family transcriptional regulator n=1 Tax=Buttiauxella sp. 3AFRM03 TaxID=2479367 RepID=UPI000EF8218C|nr:MurR/RpiR family transcriptional regulator [Buttiauxella sp. 3AFRM03]AYN28758.1 MurR/RpiR family transcriptional regulator [Buttiauxella sp. 3AFRM03]